MDKKPINPEVRKFFQAIGSKNGNELKRKYGSEYFRRMAAARKTFGRQAKPKPVENSSIEYS